MVQIFNVTTLSVQFLWLQVLFSMLIGEMFIGVMLPQNLQCTYWKRKLGENMKQGATKDMDKNN